LKKILLATTKICIFNAGKAKTFDTDEYKVLEQIKNIRVIASMLEIEIVLTKNTKQSIRQWDMDTILY
jgi:hypothetical protein